MRLPKKLARWPLSASLLAGLLGAACRPAGYVAPAVEPEPQLATITPATGNESDEELVHQALFGVESAPPSVMKPPADALISPSGLTMTVLRDGTGQRTPRAGDTVILHFEGWNEEGERFDSSITRGKPDRMRVEELVPGWREGVEAMVVGEKRRLWIPERLAFGPVPTPGRPAGDVVIDVELMEIIEAAEAPDAPSDLTTPPEDALSTASGLRFKILKKGTGKVSPKDGDRVVVHYSGWMQDGTLFDSSITRGQPAVFGVNDVIPGWTETLKLMVVGEQRRVWIPAKLAYGDEPQQPGAPAGPLVFDIELIDIEN